MLMSEYWPSVELIAAMARTTVSMEGEHVGFRRGMATVVCMARVESCAPDAIIVSNITPADGDDDVDFTIGFLSILSDIFDVQIMVDDSSSSQPTKSRLVHHGFMTGEPAGLYVRLPRTIGRLAA